MSIMSVTITGSALPECLKVTFTREIGTDNASYSADWIPNAAATMSIDDINDKSIVLAETLARNHGLLATGEHVVRRRKQVTVTRWDAALIAGAAVLACVIISKLMR